MPPADLRVYERSNEQISTVGAVSVRDDLFYTNDQGEENKGVRRRAQQALQKLSPALQRLLLSDETLLSIISASSPLSILEQLTAAWWTRALAACRIVVTNKRILFLPVKRDGSWRESARAVQWGDLVEVKSSGWIGRVVTFKFRSGAKITYANVGRVDAKKLAAIARTFLSAASGELSATQGFG